MKRCETLKSPEIPLKSELKVFQNRSRTVSKANSKTILKNEGPKSEKAYKKIEKQKRMKCASLWSSAIARDLSPWTPPLNI